MSVLIKINWGNKLQLVQAEPGEILSNILRANGPFDLPCGGKSVCRRCRVRAKGGLSALTDIELESFSHSEIKSGTRLACLTRAEGDVEIFVEDKAALAIMDQGASFDFSADPLFSEYGVTADIGTTTVCMRLYGLSGLVGGLSVKNPQTAFGADVMSRIEHYLNGNGEDLANAIRTALSDMSAGLAAKAGIDAKQISAAVLTGNTTMLYLLTGSSPKSLSRAPFNADRLFGEFTDAKALFPGLDENASVYLPRCMSAFVGADITMALLASGLCDGAETGLLVDIGTNAEIALWHREKLFVCSAAAGPAFEGSGLSSGVYGIDGAVDHVWLENGAARYSTINNKTPVGICGSGIADALAVILDAEIIDETGAFNDDGLFRIADTVSVNQKDVRKLQLSKSAVRAGMETLLRTADIGWGDIKVIFIAGGFGSFLNLNSAARIGLLPSEALPRARVIGNAALAGASMLLQNRAQIEKSRRIAELSRTVQLDRNPVFSELYVDWMMFEP
ncbi:MAG: ASKHA domain-containing protein [Clostridiales bacterium]|jgi:uncharacterized 2Fe-2S/4Fe-4S cluster protein (DUF4445 family)|nr:ASKHA domain-containing protein [Clostridiales bacterium]